MCVGGGGTVEGSLIGFFSARGRMTVLVGFPPKAGPEMKAWVQKFIWEVIQETGRKGNETRKGEELRTCLIFLLPIG